MTTTMPVVATTIGDPAGIGPEICVRSVCSDELSGLARPLLIGSLAVLERAAGVCGLKPRFRAFGNFGEVEFRAGEIAVLDTGRFDPASYSFGKNSASCGQAVLDWMGEARALAEGGKIDAWVNAPIDTKSVFMTGISHEDAFLQFDPPGTFQLRTSGPLRAVPITEHLRMRDVPGNVKRARVLEVVRLVHKTLEKWGLPDARIAVAGLNPHAMFEEDREEIAPAVRDAVELGIRASGPATPDAVFRMALDGKYDAIVTMYHDQGQIPLKTAVFEGACTLFLGLGYLRVGTPHGSAFDIAGTGKAQFKTMLAAMNTAASLIAGKGFPG